jgi:PAS domain S-box-containing protein
MDETPGWAHHYEIIFCIFLGALAYLWGGNAHLVLPQALYLLALLLGLNFAAGRCLKRWPDLEWVAALIIIANCAAVTGLLAYSGAVASNLWVLYLLPIVTACVLLRGREAFWVTAGAVAFLSAYYAFAAAFGPALYFELGMKNGLLVFAAASVWALSRRERMSRWETGLVGELRQTAEGRSALLHQLLDESGVAVFAADAGSGRVVAQNRATEELFGYSRAEFGGLQVSELDSACPSDEDPWRRLYHRLRGIKHETFAMQARRKDGGCWPAEVKASLVSHRGRDYLLAVVRQTKVR